MRQSTQKRQDISILIPETPVKMLPLRASKIDYKILTYISYKTRCLETSLLSIAHLPPIPYDSFHPLATPRPHISCPQVTNTKSPSFPTREILPISTPTPKRQPCPLSILMQRQLTHQFCTKQLTQLRRPGTGHYRAEGARV
jgi:hypothetical protein